MIKILIAGLTTHHLYIAANILVLLLFVFLIYLFNLVHSRRHGFKTGEDLDFIFQGQGEPLFYFRIASMGLGWSRYKNCLKITGYRDFLHVKLIKLFGGGSLLIPMTEAEITYRTTLFGKMAVVSVQGKRYSFTLGVTEQIRKYYDKSCPE